MICVWLILYSKAIFSTSFFDFQSGGAAGVVSKKFWVYWAFNLPITIAFLAMWYLWQQRTLLLLKKRDEVIQQVETEIFNQKREIWKQPLNEMI
jgi:hypothetical protein